MTKEDLTWIEESGEKTVYEFVRDLITEADGPVNYERARGLLLRIKSEGTGDESVILIGDTNLEGGVCDDCRDKSLVIARSESLVDLINSL
jgi:hypothetical protein